MVECVIGELFVRKYMVDPTQVERGLSAQVSYGGRLGTNLVELGLLNLDQVAEGLSLQHGVPMATVEAFEQATSAVLGAMSREICGRFNVVPLRVSAGTLHVAMMDPQHLTLVSRLGNAVGMTIQPYTAPQLRLLYYLERHYGIKRPERYLRIPFPDDAVEGERRSYLQPTLGAAQQRSVGSYSYSGGGLARTLTGPHLPRIEGIPQTTGPALPQLPPRADQASKEILMPPGLGQPGPNAAQAHPQPELVMLDDRGEPVTGRRSIPSADGTDAGSMPELDFEVHVDEGAEGEYERETSRAGMLTLDEALARMERAPNRQALLKQLIHPVLPETSLNLLLLVRGDVAIAVGAWGTDLAPASVRALALPLGMDSLIKRAFQERVVVRGPGTTCRLQKMIAVFFRRPIPREACVTPICFGGRVVNMVCAHSTDKPFADGAVGDMLSLSARAAASYKRLIEAAKAPQP